MKFALALIICLVGLTVSGCVPLRFPTTPLASGKISDASSGRPIEGSTVFWTSAPEKKEKSQRDGSYVLPSLGRTRWVLPVGDYFVGRVSGSVRVEARGYESQEKVISEISCGFGNADIKASGDFSLKPIRSK
jgi:hypothetical protein